MNFAVFAQVYDHQATGKKRTKEKQNEDAPPKPISILAPPRKFDQSISLSSRWDKYNAFQSHKLGGNKNMTRNIF